ncbi:MAG: glycolate oxidase subunit GlcE [Oleiphilaceae bacterium]|nr:glycolate oxidase subunit GlcE [Oleiphilaceae bacterium]
MQVTEAGLIDQVRAAVHAQTPLCVSGSGSKTFIGCATQGRSLDVRQHTGIVEYEPSELVITVRAGTLLSELNEVLAANNQFLPFEPPMVDGSGTVGGMLAVGWSGAGRPWYGALRDYVLGLRLINGRGEVLRFGGRVMKNVAGYDVSRLMCGSLGTMGVITEVSLKVLPLPIYERSFSLALGREDLLARAKRWAAVVTPVTAIAHTGEMAIVRLRGDERLVHRFAAQQHMLDSVPENFWQQLQQWQLPLLNERQGLWRVSLPPGSLWSSSASLLDWGGAQYFVKDSEGVDVVQQAASLGGYAYACFAGCEDGYPRISGARAMLHQRLKQAFDPHNLFAPGRLGIM